MAIAAPRAAYRRRPAKIYRLGTLTVGPPISRHRAAPARFIIAALAQRGYALGQNLAYEARGAAGKIRPDGEPDAGIEGRQCRCGGDGWLSLGRGRRQGIGRSNGDRHRLGRSGGDWAGRKALRVPAAT